MSVNPITHADLPGIVAAHCALTAITDAPSPAMILGTPGIGKSEAVEQAARAALGEAGGFITLNCATLDTSDLAGLPWERDGRLVHLPMGALPDAATCEARGVLFLDEAAQANDDVQAALMQLTLTGRVGGYVLPAGWTIILAGNYASDGAGAGRINRALANRAGVYDLAADVDAWRAWAERTGLDARVSAFIAFRPDLLNTFDPRATINATPRAWSLAAAMLGRDTSPALARVLVQGRVGEGPATEFMAFLRVWDNLPDLDAVARGEDVATPHDPATRFATCAALARRATRDNFAHLMAYAGRMGAEWAAMLDTDATTRDPELLHSDGHAAFVREFGGAFL